MRFRPHAIGRFGAGVSLLLANVASAQELETETARVIPSGYVKNGAGFEFQTSSEGTESSVPTFVEVGFLDRLELVVEPVLLTAIRPKHGPSATGEGDLELTLLGLVVHEQPWFPALALAAEMKVPTARKPLIGTREYDYTGYLILSKRFGDLYLHLNGGYAVLGQPPGTQVDNIFVFAAAAKYQATKRLDVFVEVLGDTSSMSEGQEEADASGASAELAGGELVGTVGAGYRIAKPILLSLGVSYDNNDAIIIHPGVTFESQVF